MMAAIGKQLKQSVKVFHNFTLYLLLPETSPVDNKISMALVLMIFMNTVKFLNFGMPENFAVIYLKFKQRGQTLGYFVKKNANGIANSEDPDQTAPLGAV